MSENKINKLKIFIKQCDDDDKDYDEVVRKEIDKYYVDKRNWTNLISNTYSKNNNSNFPDELVQKYMILKCQYFAAFYIFEKCIFKNDNIIKFIEKDIEDFSSIISEELVKYYNNDLLKVRKKIYEQIINSISNDEKTNFIREHNNNKPINNENDINDKFVDHIFNNFMDNFKEYYDTNNSPNFFDEDEIVYINHSLDDNIDIFSTKGPYYYTKMYILYCEYYRDEYIAKLPPIQTKSKETQKEEEKKSSLLKFLPPLIILVIIISAYGLMKKENKKK